MYKVIDAEKFLANKPTEALHEIGEQLEAAVHVLKKKSMMVTGDEQARLASVLDQLDKAMDDLHHDMDTEQARLELSKNKSLLPSSWRSIRPACCNCNDP
jgi:G3E family GTPase